MKIPTKFVTLATVFLLGMSGFCYQALAQTHGEMMMEGTTLSYESAPCSSAECYSLPSHCCDDDDHELALLSLRAHPSFKKQVIGLLFQPSFSLFQQNKIQRGFHSFVPLPAPPPSLTGIIVKKE